jgi:hypothetical protein
MDAFESLISMLLRHQGYWTTPSFKVELTKEEKRKIGKPSSPRWELDLIAYKPADNEILAVECKSLLDSTGVVFRNGKFEPEKHYKLFSNEHLRSVVIDRLGRQLRATGSTAAGARVRLCLAIGKIATKTDSEGLRNHFRKKGWLLFDSDWIRGQLLTASKRGYENDVAFIVSKLLLRHSIKARE